MDERAAFLRAICAEPDDDTPRLVYADWLQEHGEEDRAEFIRVQCELTRLDNLQFRGSPRFSWLHARERELLGDPDDKESNAVRWMGGFTKKRVYSGAKWYECGDFRRGFLSSICLSSSDFCHAAERIATEHPLVATVMFSEWERVYEPTPLHFWEEYHSDLALCVLPYSESCELRPAPNGLVSVLWDADATSLRFDSGRVELLECAAGRNRIRGVQLQRAADISAVFRLYCRSRIQVAPA